MKEKKKQKTFFLKIETAELDLRECLDIYFRQSNIDVQQKRRHPGGLGLMQEGKSGRKQQKNREEEEKKSSGSQACAPAAVREAEG